MELLTYLTNLFLSLVYIKLNLNETSDLPSLYQILQRKTSVGDAKIFWHLLKIDGFKLNLLNELIRSINLKKKKKH